VLKKAVLGRVDAQGAMASIASSGCYRARRQAIARGEDDRPVNPNRERKSSGSETTFDRDLTEPDQIEAGVLSMADDVWAWCDRTGARGRTVTVKIKWAVFQQATRSRSIGGSIGLHEVLRRLSLELVRSVHPPRTGIRPVGVSLSNFETAPDEAAGQLALALTDA
jgi:DNA polymerase-4